MGTACHVHKGEVCVDCDDGSSFLTHDGRCGTKSCLCPNGTAVEDKSCTTNRGIICANCDHGFMLYEEAKQCVAASCTCKGGMPGSKCANNGEESCASCKENHHLDGHRCVPNKCSCSNGKAATGDMCLQDNIEVCTSCDLGFSAHVKADSESGHMEVLCKENTCTCDHGTAATLEDCHRAGGHICSACKNDGFFVSKRHHCEEKTCECAHGLGVVGKECLENGMENCASCKRTFDLMAGDYKDTKKCVSHKDEEAIFDCDAGYTKRLLGWSALKKNWCCKNKKIACVKSDATGLEACHAQLPKDLCEKISCCAYDTNEGCKSKVGNDVCEESKLIQLAASKGALCLSTLTSLHEPVNGVTLAHCNEVGLGKKTGQAWRYDQDKVLRSLHADKCLAVVGEGKAIALQACIDSDEEKVSWISVADGKIKIGEFCLAAKTQEDGADIISVGCSEAKTTQLLKWNVPQVNATS